MENKTVGKMLADVNVSARFREIIGDRAPAFISSILSAVRGNAALENCDPQSIISAAAVAASLDLPINGSFGSAAIIPYQSKKGLVAQFQIMRTGWLQLAMRTGQYKIINDAVVYEGELVSEDKFTGEFVFSHAARKSDKRIGFVAYFKLKDGFEKYVYMTESEIQSHGKRYSKSFENGLWKTDFEIMGLKTVLKRAIKKWGPVSISSQLTRAIETDQALIRADGSPEYLDSPIQEIKEEEIPMPKAKTAEIEKADEMALHKAEAAAMGQPVKEGTIWPE